MEHNGKDKTCNQGIGPKITTYDDRLRKGNRLKKLVSFFDYAQHFLLQQQPTPT